MAILNDFPQNLIQGDQSFQLIDIKTSEVVDIKTTAVNEVEVIHSATLMQNSNELGIEVIDSKVINPTQVNVTAFCDLNGFKKLQTLRQNTIDRKTLYRVKVKGLMIDNVVLTHMSSEQNVEILNYYKIQLQFAEILLNSKNQNLPFAQDGDKSSIFNTIKNKIEETGKKVENLVKEIF